MNQRMGIVPFWKGYDRKEVLKAARLADELGYHSIWIPEVLSYEQFQLLTEEVVGTGQPDASAHA